MMSTICHDHWAVQRKLFLDGWKSMVVVIPTCCQHLNKSWVKPNPRLSLSFLNVTRRYKDKNGKEYTKILQSGCGVSCQKQLGSPDLDCPSCKKFTWHRPCLERAFQQRGFDIPDFTQKWSCLQCNSKQKWIFGILWILRCELCVQNKNESETI